MKDTYYFSHDYEPTSDPKIVALLNDHGWAGYGLFWRIIEMLHSEQTHKLPKKKFIFIALSNSSTPVEQVSTFVEQCLTDYELFSTDGEHFWSERVLRNINKRNINIKNKSKAGKASAKSRVLNNSSTPVEQNPTKERKGKERKGNKRIIFTAPILEDVVSYFTANGYSTFAANKAFKYYSETNWIDSRGNKVRNWKQKMQAVWFKDEYKSQENGEHKIPVRRSGSIEIYYKTQAEIDRAEPGTFVKV